MYDASGRQGREGRRMPRGATALEEIVLETRCQRCRSLILAERIDASAPIPIVEDGAPMICASCATPEGRMTRPAV